MKASRPFLHILRLADAVLFWPILGFVVWGELSPASSALPIIAETNDKLLHFIAYFGLSGMASAAVKERSMALKAAAALILLGGGLEIIQGFIGRDMELYDEVANTLGVFSGTMICRAIIEPLRLRVAPK